MASIETLGAPSSTDGLQPYSCDFQNQTLHPQREGVFIFDNIPSEINPIKKIVSGLGPIELMHNDLLGVSERVDRWYRISIDGFGYGVHITKPDPREDSGVNIFDFGGFTEMIEVGSAKSRHDNMAKEMPNLTVISVANDGMGETGEKLTVDNFLDHGVNEMAKARVKFIEALCADNPAIVGGCSMGSLIAWKTLAMDARNGHNLNAYPLGYASALVPEGKTWLYMATLFPPSMAIDTPRELIRMLVKRGPGAIKELASLAHNLEGNALPISIHGISLMGGIAVKDLMLVSEVYRGGISISGQFDPLRQSGLLGDVKKTHKDLHIRTVPRRGHGMAADGKGAAGVISHSLARWDVIAGLAA